MNDDWHMLAEEERLFCDVLTRICAEQIAPKAAHTDEAAAFVHDQLAVLGQAGMMGANLPEDYDGSGVSAPALLRAVAIVAGVESMVCPLVGRGRLPRSQSVGYSVSGLDTTRH